MSDASATGGGPKGLLDRISQALSAISALCLFLLTGLVAVSVFYRYVLSDPIRATEDLMGIFLGLTIFTAFPLVTLRRAHIQIELLVGLTRPFPRLDRLRLLLIDLGTLAVIGFVGWKLVEQAVKFYKRGVVTDGMSWPLGWLIACFAGLALFSALLFALRVGIDQWRAWTHKDRAR